jgi:hypothetical protein
MIPVARWIGMFIPAGLLLAVWRQTKEEISEMLAPLTFFVLVMVIAFTETLLIYWAGDPAETEIGRSGSRPAISELPVDARAKRHLPLEIFAQRDELVRSGYRGSTRRLESTWDCPPECVQSSNHIAGFFNLNSGRANDVDEIISN